MLELIIGKYRVCIVNAPTYTVGSSDNILTYDHEYHLDNARAEYAITSRHVVRVLEGNELIRTCILLAGGGASGVHAHSAVTQNGSCTIAVGPFMVSLRIPTLELNWSTKTDTATCFGVYRSEKHHCFISHGELEISRVSLDGDLIWQSGGADIFTNGITIHDDSIYVADFNNKEYTFDIETGREKAP